MKNIEKTLKEQAEFLGYELSDNDIKTIMNRKSYFDLLVYCSESRLIQQVRPILHSYFE